MISLPRSKAEALAVGSSRYFTGEPCKNGHVTTRNIYGHCHGCVRDAAKTETRKERAREYAKRPERQEYVKAWREANRGKVCSYTGKWRTKNPAAGAEYMRRQREERHAELLAAERERYQERREYFAEKARKYREENPEIFAVHARNRRARKKAAPGTHTRADVLDLLQQQKCRCASCRSDVSGGYHVDHIVPLVLGGGNGKDNLQILCPTCNWSKGPKDPVEFAQEILGRLL